MRVQQQAGMLLRSMQARSMNRCPHCSFDPTSSGDFCEKHRPKHEWTVDAVGGGVHVTPEEIAAGWPVLRGPWESMIPKDEVFKGHITLSSGALIMGEFVHASLARLFAQEVERLGAKMSVLEETRLARLEIIEECALVADTYRGVKDVAGPIATHIRALKGRHGG